MRGVVIGIVGVAVGLGGGYLFGKKAKQSSGPGQSTSDTTSQTTGSSTGQDLLSLCYMSGSSEDEIFKLDGKSIQFSQLPLDFRTSYLNTLEEGYRRHLDLFEKTAIRLRVASDEGKSESISDLPPLEDLLPEKTKVTDKEIKDYYEENKAGFPKGLTFDKIKPSLMGHLTELKKRSVQDELKSLLDDPSKISWNLAPQCPPTFQLDIANRPVAGNPASKNVVMFLTDFMCPECRVVWPKLEASMRDSGDQFKIAPVLMTQENNQYSSEFNRALFCASKEGDAKFVQFLNLAHTMPINYQNDLAKVKEHIKVEITRELQVDGEAFEACMRTPEADKFVADAVSLTKNLAGFRLPSLTLNGKPVFSGNTAESSTVLLKKVFATKL